MYLWKFELREASKLVGNQVSGQWKVKVATLVLLQAQDAKIVEACSIAGIYHNST